MNWRQLFFVLLLILPMVSYAQFLPLQGKLQESGQVVTGQRNFQFSIISGTVNWTETQNNIPVNNGLYAVVLGAINPLPVNLFAGVNSLPLNIQVNGQSIGAVTLYAPLESDPGVPAALKDGVSWEEIDNKPTLDESTTNELQQLSINGSELSISNGNSITLPSDNGGETLYLGSVETTTVTALEQPNFDGSSTRSFIWQSFSLTQTVKLKSLELNFGNSFNVDVRFRLYPGEGIGGQFIWSNDFPAANYGSTTEFQAFPIDALTDITLEAGEVYTFNVQGVGDDLIFRRSETDPYPYGTTNISSTTDAVFRIIAELEDGYTLEVTPNAMIVEPPLTVKDRIRDKTGWVMPVGAVVPFAGADAPDGWLLCDGTAVRRDQYADLFQAIGTAWGAGDGSNTFNLPDMRGRFARGVDQGVGNDPDAAARTALNGGNSGDNIGSYQTDETKPHDHFLANEDVIDVDGFPTSDNHLVNIRGYGTYYAYALTASDTEPSILRSGLSSGAESRPKNANFNFIIKY